MRRQPETVGAAFVCPVHLSEPGTRRPGQAEVDHLHDSRRRDHDVGRLQVAMYDSFLMGRFQHFRNLPGVVESRFNRQPAFERCALDQLPHQCLRFHSVDLPDVRMIQRRQHLRFTLEAGESFGVPRQSVRQDFDRDVAAKLRVLGAIHVAHSARANRGQDLIWTQTSSSRERHGALADSIPLEAGKGAGEPCGSQR